MNAPALAPPVLTPLAVQNIAVLQALKAGGHESIADLARALGRDKSNLRNTLASLTEAGLVIREDLVPVPVITAAGDAALTAWARANGVREVRAGDGPVVLHRQIRPDPNQPRKHFDFEALDELRESIVADDLLENLVVRPDPERATTDDGLPAFMLIAGERRWRAIELAIQDGDWDADRPVGVTVRDVDEATTRRLALIENMQRKDLRPAEEARAIQAYMELQAAGTAEVAAELKRTQRWVQQRLQLLELPQDLLWKVDDGQLKVEDARLAAALWPRLPPIKQLELREGKITVTQAKAWLEAQAEPEAAVAEDEDDRTQPEILINPEGAHGDRPTLPQIATMQLPMGRTITCGRAGISLTVGQIYVLCELAHKAAADGARPAGNLDDCAYIAPDAGQDRDFAILWRNGHIAWGRGLDGRYFARLSPFGRERIAGGGFPTAYIEKTGYRTPWLRADEATITPPPAPLLSPAKREGEDRGEGDRVPVGFHGNVPAAADDADQDEAAWAEDPEDPAVMARDAQLLADVRAFLGAEPGCDVDAAFVAATLDRASVFTDLLRRFGVTLPLGADERTGGEASGGSIFDAGAKEVGVVDAHRERTDDAAVGLSLLIAYAVNQVAGSGFVTATPVNVGD